MSDAIQSPADGTPVLARMVEAMRADLSRLASSERGSASVARDPVNVLELLHAATGLLLVLHVAEDENVSPDGPAAPVLAVTFEVTVQRRMGLDERPDAAMSANRGDGRPLFELADRVRARVLAWRLPSTLVHRGRLAYLGQRPVTTPEGAPTAAYALRFRLRMAAPMATFGSEIPLPV